MKSDRKAKYLLLGYSQSFIRSCFPLLELGQIEKKCVQVLRNTNLFHDFNIRFIGPEMVDRECDMHALNIYYDKDNKITDIDVG